MNNVFNICLFPTQGTEEKKWAFHLETTCEDFPVLEGRFEPKDLYWFTEALDYLSRCESLEFGTIGVPEDQGTEEDPDVC